MRSSVAIVAALVFSLVVSLAWQAAQAANVYKYTLASVDAGATQQGVLLTSQTYEITCSIPACYKTDSTTVAPDCTKDVPAPVNNSNGAITAPLRRFNSGVHNAIAAYALDAGDPACKVYLIQGGF